MIGSNSRYLAALVLALVVFVDNGPCATTTNRVRMYFNVGSVDFDLYGIESPLHVANFLQYVDEQAYDRTWIHRSFCCGSRYFLQGGQFYLPEPSDDTPDLHSVVPGATVPNEYDPSNGLTNSPGTIAAARASDLDSARNGWFINTTDNSSPFAFYTVFGEATRGFNVVQFISSLPINHPYLSSHGYDTAPVFHNFFVYLKQVVELSLLDGDFDFSGDVGASDFVKWQQDYGRALINGPDLNGDLEIDSTDLVNWEVGFGNFDGLSTFASFGDGDANRDGTVNGFDFLNWQRYAGHTTDVSADANGDYEVNGLDFLEWQQHAGSVSLMASVAGVPEPSTQSLCCLGLLALGLNRRRKT